MSGRRELFLQEMGLGPVWRLKAAPQELAIAESVAPGEAPGWAELRRRVEACTLCDLHQSRTRAVFGVGDENADWLFIGEAPGADEDAQGEPFVGQAGKLLDNMLKSIGLRRGDNVYIANVLKSRPPNNRNPLPDEIAACMPYLRRQVELIQPKLIVTLGKIASEAVLGREATIASLRGQVHYYLGIPLIVTYHPAYLLRTLPDKAKAWQDLCLARETMQRLSQSTEAGTTASSIV